MNIKLVTPSHICEKCGFFRVWEKGEKLEDLPGAYVCPATRKHSAVKCCGLMLRRDKKRTPWFLDWIPNWALPKKYQYEVSWSSIFNSYYDG